MEQEHLIIVAMLAVILYMIMKHSENCNCGSCMQSKMVPPFGRVRADLPERIRMRRDGELPSGPSPLGHVRVSDKYIGAGQAVKGHIRYDNRNGMFNGMFSGNPSHRIRYDCDVPGGNCGN